MKSTILILLSLLANLSFSQIETENYKRASKKFVKNYNNDDYNEIFSMFSDIMKEELPIDKAKDFFSGLKSQAGNITKHEFVKYENETYASYKTFFDRAVLVLNISLDDKSKINGLFIKPFVEDINSKIAINNLAIEKSFLTKEQSEIIFEKSKFFPNNTEIAIAFIKNGKANFYGTRKEGDTISKVDNQKSVFEIGSISKVFTSTLLADFVINKKIKLNDNINDFLKTPFNNGTKIKFIDLANHTSGLVRMPTNIDFTKVDPENPYKEYKEKELLDYLSSHLELSNKGAYQYSNLGAGILGYTLSKIENLTYEELLQKVIFSKYDMQNSTSDIDKINGNLVRGLNAEGKEIPNWSFSVLAGAGGIFSTVEDLSNFAISQFDSKNKTLKLTREKTIEINSNMDIGLGWHVLKPKSDKIWHWHNGGTGGYSSSMAIEEESKNGIIILSNVSAYSGDKENIDALCFELMKTMEK